MQLAGSKSWRLNANIDEVTNASLYIRDSLDIASYDRSHIPPSPLRAGVIDHRDLLVPELQQPASDLWNAWWQMIMEGWTTRPRQRSGFSGLTQLHPARLSVIPASLSHLMTEGSALSEIVRPIYREAQRWVQQEMELWCHPVHPSIDQEVALHCAEVVARTSQVGLDQVHAEVRLVLTDVPWWQQRAPGMLIASVAAASNATFLEQMLLETFYANIRWNRYF